LFPVFKGKSRLIFEKIRFHFAQRTRVKLNKFWLHSNKHTLENYTASVIKAQVQRLAFMFTTPKK